MTMRSLLEQYLALYDSRINMVIDMFIDKFGVRNPGRNWRLGLIDRTGFLDENNLIEYSFHGGGCTVWIASKETISFDFLEDDDYHFDNYKFFLFLQSINIPLEHEHLLGITDNLTLYVEKADGHFLLKNYAFNA